jgi:hypothetical protein
VAAYDPPLFCTHGLRDFSEGLVAVVLPAYLVALGYTAGEVSAVGTIALLGSALMTLGVGLRGTLVDPGSLLLATVALMVGTALGFASAAGLAK